MEFLKLFWPRWWLRGVTAALGLLLFMREFFGYTLFETTGAVLAALAVWRDVLAWAGSFVGRLPFMPPLSAEQALYLSLLISLSAPAAFRAVKDLTILRNETVRTARVGRINEQLRALEDKRSLQSLLRRRALKGELRRLQRGANRSEVALSLLLFLAAGASSAVLIALVAAPGLKFGGITSAAIVIAVLVAFALACRIRAYLIGAVTLLTFLATFQLAYWLDAPQLRAWVQSHAASAPSAP